MKIYIILNKTHIKGCFSAQFWGTTEYINSRLTSARYFAPSEQFQK